MKLIHWGFPSSSCSLLFKSREKAVQKSGEGTGHGELVGKFQAGWKAQVLLKESQLQAWGATGVDHGDGGSGIRS